MGFERISEERKAGGFAVMVDRRVRTRGVKKKEPDAGY